MELNKTQLLQDMFDVTDGYGIAEAESPNEQRFMKDFLPSSQYKNIFEPTTFLMLGGRGVGKTALFKLLNYSTARKQFYQQLNRNTFENFDKTYWLTGFGLKKPFPTSFVIEKTMTHCNSEQWRTFWIGLLTGAILASFPIQQYHLKLPSNVQDVLTNHLSRLSEWLPLVEQHLEEVSDFLDELDSLLVDEDEWIFISYDELDKIVPAYRELANPIRTLLAYWLEHYRRWQRIRPKIFLRHDLFREDFLGFADASKLKPHTLKLEWSTNDLYQLFTKRLANKSEDWVTYLTDICRIPLTEDETFGKIPTVNDQKMHEQLMTAIIGQFMGANARKGKSYSWIPNHLQDGGGKIAPRSFLKLFALAAERRLPSTHELHDKHLLLPSDLQNGLQQTSEDRIQELTEEEYPWLIALIEQLKNMEVPTDQAKFIQAINDTKWQEQAPPPLTDAQELISYLQRLGIIEIRLDTRINVPEIYLYGFQMKRRGGVRRAK